MISGTWNCPRAMTRLASREVVSVKWPGECQYRARRAPSLDHVPFLTGKTGSPWGNGPLTDPDYLLLSAWDAAGHNSCYQFGF